MKWPSIKKILTKYKPPKGYKLDQLSLREVPELVKQLKRWYPTIRVGSESSHLEPSFYYRSTYLKGGDSTKRIFPFVLRFDKRIVAILTLKMDPDAHILTGALGASDPAHRGHGFANSMITMAVATGQIMKAGMIYFIGTLQHLFSQKAYEANEFKIVGILPAFDRDYFPADKTIKRVPEAIYAKVLCSEKEIRNPTSATLTPSAKRLWRFLFDEKM